MTRTIRFGSLLMLLLSLMLVMPARAADGTYFEFLDVSHSSCAPGNFIGYHFIFGIADGDESEHIWTTENPRTGTSSGPDTVGPFSENEDAEEFSTSGEVSVPSGTQAGDTLVTTVVATSETGDGTTSIITFDCATGEVFSITDSNGNRDDDEGEPFDPGDDRLNQTDAGASYSVYCREDGSISVFAIPTDGVPFESFVATLEDIAAVEANPAAAAVIDSGAAGNGGTLTLYRRPDGFFQVNGRAQDASKGYFVAFDGCPATNVSSWEA